MVPSLLKWRSKAVLNRLKQNYKEASQASEIDFDKVEEFLHSFLERKTSHPETGQNPAFAYCPKLTARPFWSETDSELTALVYHSLRSHEQAIKQEYLKVVANNTVSMNDIDTGKGHLKANSWKNIKLGDLTSFPDYAKKEFPQTLAALEPFKHRIFSAELIVMEPDTVLPPHTDATNAYLVCHLGLEVKKNCGLQVHREIREFHEGDIIFFDQSYVHSAWNKGDDTRANLLITFFHPEISEQEIILIREFMHRIKKQALIFSPLMLIEYGFLKLFSRKP